MTRRCKVSFVGKDLERHSTEVDAESLFDAVEKGARAFSLLWFFDPDAVVEGISGDERWFVEQRSVRQRRLKNEEAK